MTYWCPSTGRYHEPLHGGLEVCCPHPERHTEYDPAFVAALKQFVEKNSELLRRLADGPREDYL